MLDHFRGQQIFQRVQPDENYEGIEEVQLTLAVGSSSASESDIPPPYPVFESRNSEISCPCLREEWDGQVKGMTFKFPKFGILVCKIFLIFRLIPTGVARIA